MERINSSEDEQHECDMSKMLQALQDLERENQELAAENASLKELEAESASLEEQEDVNSHLEEVEAENTRLKELEVLNSRLEAENALLKAENARMKELEAENARLVKLEAKNAWPNMLMAENASLKQPEGENVHLEEPGAEIVQVKELEAENPLEKLRAENVALKKQITMKNISWGEERMKMVEKFESSTSVLLKSKEDLTSLIRLVESEKATAKELEKKLKNVNMSFKVKEEEVVSLSADLKLQEDKLQHYILENEGRPEEIEELQKKMRDLTESWSTEHEESLEKTNKLEEHIKLLTQQNIVLKEQALKTDSFKERVKKEKEEKKDRKKSGKEEKMEKREKEEIEGTRRLPCFLFNFKT